MNKIKHHISYALLALMLVSCVSSGFKIEDARRITMGMTENEVVTIMGEPYSKNISLSNEIWIWVDVKATPNFLAPPTYNSKSFSVIMKYGRVSSIY